MNTVASLISGQFTRSLILGSFFPVVLFLFFGYLVLDPLLPHWQWLVMTHNLSAEGKAGVISAGSIVATIFLYNLNTPIIRLLEGYPWKGSKYGRKKIGQWKAEFAAITALLPRLRLLRAQWDALKPDDPDRRNVQDILNRLQETLVAEYPNNPHLILPTRFGNVLRSFETYPLRQYAMDGVALWPRIVSVADKDTRDMVEDARSGLDFFVNCMVLSAILGAGLFTLGCLVLNQTTPPWQMAAWALEVLGAATIARVFYAACLSKIAAWGGQVKSVFDLFRGDLLKKMGYTQVVTTREQERDLWREISRQAIYGDPATRGRALLEYVADATAQTSISTQTQEISFEVTSGLQKIDATTVEIHHRIKNLGGSVATNLVLTERIMDGFAYIWDSAKKGTHVLPVTGTNPHQIGLGDLAAGAHVEISYQAVDLRRPAP
jgi:hypothetical protein